MATRRSAAASQFIHGMRQRGRVHRWKDAGRAEQRVLTCRKMSALGVLAAAAAKRKKPGGDHG